MADPERPDRGTPPRKPFEGWGQAEPFHRSPEFQRFIWLSGALVAVLFLGLYVSSRMQPVAAPREGAAPGEAPSPLPSSITPEEHERRMLTLFEGALADTRNGDDFAETSGYRNLLRILASFTAEEVSRRATRKLDPKAALQDPEAWQGEFVWHRGLVAEVYANRLRQPVPGRTDVYRVILAEADGTEGVFVDLTGERPEVELREDPVDVEGVFYRTVRYESVSGKVREAPYLIARNLRPVTGTATDRSGILRDRTALALVGMALAIGVARLLMYVFRRRPARRAPPPPASGAGFRQLFDREQLRGSGPRRGLTP